MTRPRRTTALPAVQRRSAETRDRLLDAAEAVIRTAGPEGCTVPVIAVKAGVAVGSVYRRFPDKDALLRAVHDRFFERSVAANRAALDLETCRGLGAGELVAGLVRGIVVGYRAQRGLLAGLIRYAERHPDPAFRRASERARDATFADLRTLLAGRLGDLTHPHPTEAVEFVLAVVASVARGAILERRAPLEMTGDDRLIEELTRLALAYLGIKVSPSS